MSPDDAAAVVDLAPQACDAYGRDDLVPRLTVARQRLFAPSVRVLVVGEFKQGKSTLVNALLRTDICPVDSDVVYIEPVRYGQGSNAMGLLSTLATKGGGPFPRWLVWLGTAITHPGRLLSLYAGISRWSQRTIIALVMQTHDNSLTLYPKRGVFGRLKVTSKPGGGLPNPTWIPAAHEALERMSRHIDGFPGNSIGEIFDIPMTAHFLGGCAIGDGAATGVVDPYHRMYGHPGLHVVDGSAISANLGVNPSLTITAQAERAMSLWPNKGEADPRPPIQAPYRRLQPVPPRSPVVPVTAPGALRPPLLDRHR